MDPKNSLQGRDPRSASPLGVSRSCRTPVTKSIPFELGSRLRGSVTLAGPLLARTGSVTLPRPGGDRIGRRRLDTHLLILS